MSIYKNTFVWLLIICMGMFLLSSCSKINNFTQEDNPQSIDEFSDSLEENIDGEDESVGGI